METKKEGVGRQQKGFDLYELIVSGAHGNTVVFGAISLDGRQLFRQYNKFNGETFLDYLKKVHRKFENLYLFMDKAKQHYNTNIVTQYLRGNRKTLRVS